MRALKARGRVVIAIEKRLPVQGGLGAASANAVAPLLALERALKKRLPAPERLQIAAGVGIGFAAVSCGRNGAWGWTRRRGLSVAGPAGDRA